MTSTEIQKRNAKAEQLKVLQSETGVLFVESEKGKGKKFTIKLPIKKENQNDEKEIISDGKENSIVCR